jgi:hypothetical protein
MIVKTLEGFGMKFARSQALATLIAATPVGGGANRDLKPGKKVQTYHFRLLEVRAREAAALSL